ncbi:MAG: MarR family winged helix-turn-helix transcriptional regulator [Actinomycetota bacterium]|nr:MarR family winged helix-turn-helix transcriptional regulator [Actinomycetota bacterium]
MTTRSQRIDAVRALARVSRLLEHASGELSLSHYRVLAAVADGDERASRVARRLALGKPAISASVEALCRRGLLAREGVAGDQRASALRLTNAGKRALTEVETALLARLDAVLEHTRDRRALVTALANLGEALDGLADERLAQAAR